MAPLFEGAHRSDYAKALGKKEIQHMLLGRYYGAIEVHRGEKREWVKFLSPDRVMLTCGVNGGIREDLNAVYNHQSCEPNGHFRQMDKIMRTDLLAYMGHVCQGHDLNPHASASLGTAANMNNVAISNQEFRDLVVVSVCTGAVATNAGRVGDPADYFESGGQFIKLREEASVGTTGTINKDRSLANVAIVSHADSIVLDEVALRIVEKASSHFPPVPDSLMKEQLSYVVPIVFKKGI